MSTEHNEFLQRIEELSEYLDDHHSFEELTCEAVAELLRCVVDGKSLIELKAAVREHVV